MSTIEIQAQIESLRALEELIEEAKAEAETLRDAEYFLNLVLSFDPDNPEVYWGICLLRIGAPSEANIMSATLPLQDVPEFNRYLILVGDERRKQCIALARRQSDQCAIRAKKQAKEQLNQEKRQIEAEIRKLENKADTLPVERKLFSVRIFSGIGIFTLVELLFIITMEFRNTAYRYGINPAQAPFSTLLKSILNQDPVSVLIMIGGLIVSVVCLLLAGHLLRKQPSKKELKENIQKKETLQSQIRDLRKKVSNLDKALRDLD